MRHMQRGWIWAVAAVLAVAAGGCRQGPAKITGGDAALPPGEASAEFLDRVERQGSVSQNDAMRGLLLLLDGQDKAQSFRQRAQTLTGRGIVPTNWEPDAMKPITRDQLAYMVCTALKIQGGVWHTLLGHNRRYCLQELQYQGFLAPGLGNTEVSGSEFVAVMARADAYLQHGEIPKALMPK